MENNIRKILIIRLSAIGDTIHTLPLAYSLRQSFPDTVIDWVVEDKAAGFIVNNPLLNRVYVIDKKNKLKSYFEIIKKIRKEHYDIVIDVQQLLKSAVIMGFSNAKRKITQDGGREFSFIFSNEIIKTGRKLFDINYHVVKRNLDIAKYLGCKDCGIKFIIPDFSNIISDKVKDIIQNIDKSKKTILLAPATTWKNKHWTNEGWQELINEFKDNCNIIITASGKEKELINQIISGFSSNNIINLAGLTSLADLTYIFQNVDIVISPDSGSAHIAWASGAKSVITLFFATSAERTAPFGDNYYSFSAQIACSPCMSKHCRLKTSQNQCCKEINSKEIINIVKKVLQ